MLNGHTSSNKKLISKSAYAIALAVPFISLFGETKASRIISSDNHFFIEDKQSLGYAFILSTLVSSSLSQKSLIALMNDASIYIKQVAKNQAV